jgi:hypothetical protein
LGFLTYKGDQTKTEEREPTKMTDNIAELLKIHKEPVSTLLEKFSKYKGIDIGVPFDEIFILRFVLSNPKLEVAERKLNSALEWRSNNLAKITGPVPNEELLLKNWKHSITGWLNNQYLLFIDRGGHADWRSALKEMSKDELVEHLTIMNEKSFQLCDAKTRETGKLCKVITVVDLGGLSLFKFDPKFAKAFGESSHNSNVMYPQLLKMLVLLNLPFFFKVLIGIAEKFISKETQEKVKFCYAKTATQSASKCPFFSQFGPAGQAILPEFLGGTMTDLPHALQLNTKVFKG